MNDEIHVEVCACSVDLKYTNLKNRRELQFYLSQTISTLKFKFAALSAML